jgi:hypothetical protein
MCMPCWLTAVIEVYGKSAVFGQNFARDLLGPSKAALMLHWSVFSLDTIFMAPKNPNAATTKTPMPAPKNPNACTQKHQCRDRKNPNACTRVVAAAQCLHT